MATTNANESRAQDNYIDFKRRTDYKPGNNGYSKENYNRAKDNNFRQKDNNYRQKDSFNNKKENNYTAKDSGQREMRFTPGNNYFQRSSMPQRNNSTRRPYFQAGQSSDKSKENSYQSGSGTYRSRDNDYRERDNYKTYLPKSIDKDIEEDLDNRGQRSHKSTDMKGKSSQNKDKDQNPDKLEILKRLEREKKVIQRKNREEENGKVKRPSLKQKKSSRIDWTKGYEYGLLDEEIDYNEF